MSGTGAALEPVPGAPPPAPARRPAGRLALLLAIVVGCISCDHVAKEVATRELAGRPPLTFLGDAVALRYTVNEGAFLGWGASWSPAARFWTLTVGTAIALGGVAVLLVRRRHGALLPRVAGALVLGGGLGNLADRIVAGEVVDFLVLGIGPLRTGVFNAADVALTGGVALLLFDPLLRRAPDPRRAAT